MRMHTHTHTPAHARMMRPTQSAIHVAAWRGHVQNVETLLSLGADVNAASTGRHNYGKTPIFYAITRDREGMVQHLLRHGAKVRVVNNKGQSVLSLSASHIPPITLDLIRTTEEAEDGAWQNFRATHSDGLKYGDLDPRFIGNPASIPDPTLPYALDPTTKESRKNKYSRDNTGLVHSRQSHIATLDLPQPWRNVRDLVDIKNMSCLNEAALHPAQHCFHGDPRLWLESDADAEMLVSIPFRNPTDLYAIEFHLSAEFDAKHAPARLHLFADKAVDDFADARGTTPTQTLDLALPDVQIGKLVAVETKSFLSLQRLVLFFETNHGETIEAKTKLGELKLYGYPASLATLAGGCGKKGKGKGKGKQKGTCAHGGPAVPAGSSLADPPVKPATLLKRWAALLKACADTETGSGPEPGTACPAAASIYHAGTRMVLDAMQSLHEKKKMKQKKRAWPLWCLAFLGGGWDGTQRAFVCS